MERNQQQQICSKDFNMYLKTNHKLFLNFQMNKFPALLKNNIERAVFHYLLNKKAI